MKLDKSSTLHVMCILYYPMSLARKHGFFLENDFQMKGWGGLYMKHIIGVSIFIHKL